MRTFLIEIMFMSHRWYVNECFLGLDRISLLFPFLILCCFKKHSSRVCLLTSCSVTCHGKKILSDDRMMELLFNEDSDDNLIPESNYSKLSDSERPESPEVALIIDIANEATPETSPN